MVKDKNDDGHYPHFKDEYHKPLQRFEKENERIKKALAKDKALVNELRMEIAADKKAIREDTPDNHDHAKLLEKLRVDTERLKHLQGMEHEGHKAKTINDKNEAMHMRYLAAAVGAKIDPKEATFFEKAQAFVFGTEAPTTQITPLLTAERKSELEHLMGTGKIGEKQVNVVMTGGEPHFDPEAPNVPNNRHGNGKSGKAGHHP